MIVLNGGAQKKQVKVETADMQDSIMGIDPGVSTIAGVPDEACVLEELAPDANRYEKQIQQILQKMDSSRRISNPGKYNPDGCGLCRVIKYPKPRNGPGSPGCL